MSTGESARSGEGAAVRHSLDGIAVERGGVTAKATPSASDVAFADTLRILCDYSAATAISSPSTSGESDLRSPMTA